MTQPEPRPCAECGALHRSPGALCVQCTGITQTLVGGELTAALTDEEPIDAPPMEDALGLEGTGTWGAVDDAWGEDRDRPTVDGDPWAATPWPEDDPAEIETGTVIGDRFEICELLGEGGAGRVYRAWQPDLERELAIKVLHPQLSTDPRIMQRFHREARAASQLRHPCAVVVHDFGEWAGQLYIAMEFLRGETLADIIEREFPLAEHRIVALLSQACEVLEEAHGQGIVHRDLKPENLMVITDPIGREMVKVVDFGLAIPTEAPDETRLTVENTVVGTPAYMSPEQCRGKAVTAASDIYTMGAILYELLCGTVPFDELNAVDLMVKTILSVPTPPSKRRTDIRINELLEGLALQSLAKRIEARPQSAAEFRARLQAAVADDRKRRDDPRRLQADGISPGRLERAAAAGLQTVPNAMASTEPSGLILAVIEAHDDSLDSLTAHARRAGFDATRYDTLEEGLTGAGGILLVDVRADPPGKLAELGARVKRGRIDGKDVVAVGPVDMDVMTSALSSGVKHYVPEATVEVRLPRLVQKLARRRR